MESDTMARLTRVHVIGALLVAMLGIPTTAQEPAATDDPLAALCHANAPDEATLATCLDIVATVLAPAGAVAQEPTPARAITTWEDFDLGIGGGIAQVMQFPMDPETDQPLDVRKKKEARRAREVAGMVSEDIRTFLLSVTPDPCYERVYVTLWGLSTAMGQYEDGLKGADGMIRAALRDVGQAMPLVTCETLWRIDVGAPDTMG